MNEAKPTRWYVGAMNDALFIIDHPPSPSGTDAPPDTPHPGLHVIAKLGTEQGYETDAAHANLIAAAPDLLAALKWAMDYISLHEDRNDKHAFCVHNCLHKQARAAIARAEGRGGARDSFHGEKA